jgi:hypothetical protein
MNGAKVGVIFRNAKNPQKDCGFFLVINLG